MDVRRLVFIDETGFNTKMTRLYGRAPRGKRCVDHVPCGHWQSSTFIAGLRHDCICAPMLFDGPMNGAMFMAYVQKVLAPTLQEKDIVICDNLSTHKVSGVKQAIESHGASIRYLPAYSPDLNPIEMLFSKLKSFIRNQIGDSFPSLLKATQLALLSCSTSQCSTSQCSNFFRHALYATNTT